jgi:hypothetical protein
MTGAMAPFLRTHFAAPIVSAIVVLLSARACWLLAAHVLGAQEVKRYHVETAFVWFVVAGLLAVVLRQHRPDDAPVPQSTSGLKEWSLFCALAIALYSPALSIGFLSDDFVLLNRAAEWRLEPLNTGLFRPLPLALWSLLVAAGASAWFFHLTNVLLHGTAAFLSGRVVGGWVSQPNSNLFAGLIVLTMPVSTEAVVWCSGVFDVLTTTFALAAVLLFRAYEARSSYGLMLLCVAAGLGAMLSKETGVVIPALLLCDAIARHSRPYRWTAPFAVIAAIAIAYAVLRLLLAFGITSLPLSRYVVQRTLFQTFGGLGLPWHGDVLHGMPWLALGHVLLVVLILVQFCAAFGSRELLRVPLAACAWILCSILPVAPILWVPADLQGSRYLYLAAAGWSGLLVSTASAVRHSIPMARGTSAAILILYVVLAAYGVRQHLQPWREAAVLRDKVEHAARTDTRMRACSSVSIQGLPDSVRGAYVFRNGGSEAFKRDLDLRVTGTPPSRDCSFEWNDNLSKFLPVSESATVRATDLP